MNSYDVIIVGTGAAGLFAALHLPPDFRILLLTKDDLENSDSYLAQGGICTLLNPEDFPCYYEDTLKAGRYENSPEAVTAMIRSSGHIIRELIRFGVNFDRNADGTLSYTREGGHTLPRILHHQDVTGQEIVTCLIQRVKERDNIEILEHTAMVDLLETGGSCRGILARGADGTAYPLAAGAVILATGGLGGLFRHSTNFPHIAGDSFAIALRCGIRLENLHYIQIHPTVLYSSRPGRRFLISESVRGEGAKLLNAEGKRFVDELLPRDVVAEAIRQEMARTGTDHVWLSFADISEEEILRHFPHIYRRCLEEGRDITREPIPVTPAQHYLMGGIRADICGRTSMANLYAVGETACNGVHGANRLASNSLLESLVFPENAAHVIRSTITAGRRRELPARLPQVPPPEEWAAENRRLVLNEIKRKGNDFYERWSNI